MIHPSDDRALYRRVADDLRHRITEGEYPAGALLPSEGDLGYHYRVGRDVIRNALRLLVDEGRVVKRGGVRTRVRDTPEMSVRDVPRGHLIGSRPANEAERAEWGLPPGAWVLVEVEESNGIEVDSHPADRTWLRVSPEE